MKISNKNGFAAFVLLGIVVLGCSTTPKGPDEPDPLLKAIGSKFAFDSAVKAKIGKFPKTWNGINISKLEHSMVVVYLEYQQMPNGMKEIESDSTKVTQAVLDSLRERQWDPKTKFTMVFVHAQKPETSATGRDMVRQFGKATYNPNTDNITFEPIN